MTVSAFNGTSVFLLHVICRRLWKNALTADGCWWHAQHGLCHRTKNRITRLMLWPVATNAWDKMCGLSAAVPRTDQLQSYRVTRSRHHVGRSRSASRVALCPNRQLWRCRRITCRSGGKSLPSIVVVVCWCLRTTPTVALTAVWRRSSVSIRMQSA